MPSASKDEFWEEIPGFDGFYEASSLGRIRSWSAVGRKPQGQTQPNRSNRPRILRPVLGQDNRFRVKLRVEGREKQIRIHRLVLLAFRGLPADGYAGCHRNDEPHDNNLENLYWGTRKQNLADSLRNGRHAVGERCPNAILSAEQVTAMRERRAEVGLAYATLGREFGVSESQASKICNRKQWKHIA